MTALCAAHGLPSTAVATPDVEELLRALKSPGAAAAFVHGDLTPNNAMIVGDTTCRLIDFEGAAIQHIGNDLCMLRFPFAWYGRWATIPPSVQRSMEHAHRGASARSDAEIDAAIAIGCAAMAILRLQRLDRIADDEQPPAMKVRRRAQIVDTVDVAVAALTAVDALPDLARWLRSMGVAMQAAWVEASAPLWPYPAFAIP